MRDPFKSMVYDNGTLEIFASGVKREGFSGHHKRIRTVGELKATLRAGGFAWPGGYPLYMITEDSGSLHFDCVKKNAREYFEGLQGKHWSGFVIHGCEINYEDNDLWCDQCSKKIDSAYGEN